MVKIVQAVHIKKIMLIKWIKCRERQIKQFITDYNDKNNSNKIDYTSVFHPCYIWVLITFQ